LIRSKLVLVLALAVAILAIFIVGGLSFIGAESSGSASSVTTEVAFAITIAAALTLVAVGVVTILRSRHETRTENMSPYNPQPFNATTPSNAPMAWYGLQFAFAARYCDHCGNRL
jgi:NADH:ubiquinone oxidoreductase subunit 6 (subunit J)